MGIAFACDYGVIVGGLEFDGFVAVVLLYGGGGHAGSTFGYRCGWEGGDGGE